MGVLSFRRRRRAVLFDILTAAGFEQVEGEVVRPAHEGRTAPLPKELHPQLADALAARGIRSLWLHQRRTWDVAQARQHVIVTTGTASGKSLSFNLPVLHDLLSQPHATALYLYPTKALTQDQIRSLRPLTGRQVELAVYDGDTPPEARRLARERSRLLLTNPDMISMGILPHHERWSDFLFNLAYVVVDEAHVYRGVFGSHVSNVLRRLRRVADMYGGAPQFILASATIRNATEHAQNLTGVHYTLVDDDAAPTGRRKIVLWNPPLADEALNLRRSPSVEAAQILVELMRQGVRTICFTKSRRGAELLYQFAVDRLEAEPTLAGRLSPYRAGYTPEQRRGIEQRLSEGDLLAVVSTNALELGIDIGALDAAITVGYPGTVASLWQQWGRAGRGRGESLGIFVAGNDAIEQFFLHRPEELLDRQVEAATTDFTNPYIHGRHLLAAAYESPLVADDAAFFGEGMPEAADRVMRETGGLRRSGETWFISGDGYPAADISLRSSSPDQFAIVDEETGDVIGSQEAETALHSLHPHAVYLHMGESWFVTDLDIDRRVAVVRRFFDTYYTQPRKESATEIVAESMQGRYGSLGLHFGTLMASNQVIAFQKKRLGGDEVLGVEELDLPVQHFITEGLWFTLPLELLPSEEHLARLPGALHAIEHAMIALLPLLAMCDRWDIGGLSTPVHHQTELPTIFVYDGYPGGVGIARQGFERFDQWLRDTRDLVRDCPCEVGCPSCIQSPKCGNWNEPLDKELALLLLDTVLAAAAQ